MTGTTMRSTLIEAFDGPASVRTATVPEPAPDPGLVRIDVHAAGVTFPDVLATRGAYQVKPPLPFAPGLEVAGTVRHAPEGSTLRPGDRVAAFLLFGGYAEVVDADPASVIQLPDSVSFVDGAALLVNHFTAHFALLRRGQLRAGQTVLVHGAAGGVGTAAIQVARAWGATVVAVTSSDEKADAATACGAHHTVRPEGFKDRARELTDGRGVDLVVDPVGGDRFTDSLRSLAPEGKVLVIGFAAGDIPTVHTNRLLLGNIGVEGVAWAEFVRHAPHLVQEQWAELAPLAADGTLRPVIDRTVPLEQAAEALELLEGRRVVGKVVLQVRP